MAACPDCDARGTITGEIDCPACKGTRSTPCLTCRGSGNELCRTCGGTGETVVQVRSGVWVRDSYRKCTTCTGRGKQRCTDCPVSSGKIECRRCKATGNISGKGECPRSLRRMQWR
jgi:DnaJ-class molecular chaperone